jgi:hypothetical protein
MKKSVRKIQQQRRRRPIFVVLRMVKWVALIAGIGLLLYAFSNSGVAYDEEDIRVVDFSSLSDDVRLSTLRAANRERCNCGCGMNLAQCVATDMTCPIRDKNIEAIRTMVREARAGS